MDDVIPKKIMRLGMIILFVLGIIICSGFVYASSDYTITNYTIDATMQENGDMHVDEFLTYSFDEDMQGLFRSILYQYKFNHQKDSMEATSSRYQANDVLNIQAYTSDMGYDTLTSATLQNESTIAKGSNHVFSIESQVDNGYRKKIKVYAPVSAGNNKYIKYSYDIKDVLVKYQDKGEFYWNFIGGDWETDIYDATINIHFPENTNMESVIVSPHTYAKQGNLSVQGNTYTYKVPYIAAGTAVDARGVFDGSVLSGNVSKVRDIPYDMQTHDSIENQMKKDTARYHLSKQLNFVIVVIAVVGLIYIAITIRKFTKGRKPTKKEIEYYTEIPEGYSLAEYNLLKNGTNSYMNPNLLNATILDLVQRKMIMMNAQKKLKKSMWDGIEYDYFMKLDKTKSYATLNEQEWLVINLLFNRFYDYKTSQDLVQDVAAMKDQEIELNDVFKKIGRSSYCVKFYQEFLKSQQEKVESKFFDKIPSKAYHIASYVVVIVLVLVVVNLFLINPMNMNSKMTELMAYVVIFFVYTLMAYTLVSANARLLKAEYKEEYRKILGLEKYLKDYSTIKDRYPIELVLWDQYLVFASLFGVAEKVSKEFKKDLVMQGYDDDYIFIHYPILNMAIYSQTINAVMATSTGSSSSGGYSGGGSGGGGRRRWRRRCFLASFLN